MDFSYRNKFKVWTKGISGTAVQNSTTDIDYTITEDLWLSGVCLILQNHEFDDTVTFEIVHPVAGVLEKFGEDYHISSDVQCQKKEIPGYWAQIPTGLILRIKYTSTGSTDVKVKANIYFHKNKQ